MTWLLLGGSGKEVDHGHTLTKDVQTKYAILATNNSVLLSGPDLRVLQSS